MGLTGGGAEGCWSRGRDGSPGYRRQGWISLCSRSVDPVHGVVVDGQMRRPRPEGE